MIYAKEIKLKLANARRVRLKPERICLRSQRVECVRSCLAPSTWAEHHGGGIVLQKVDVTWQWLTEAENETRRGLGVEIAAPAGVQALKIRTCGTHTSSFAWSACLHLESPGRRTSGRVHYNITRGFNGDRKTHP